MPVLASYFFVQTETDPARQANVAQPSSFIIISGFGYRRLKKMPLISLQADKENGEFFSHKKA
jgi:hypothetical protein